MRLPSLVLSLSGLYAVRAQYASTYPAPIPLFHKSPYLNSFIPPNASANWPAFFMPPNQGWFLGLRVDGSPYLIQGVHTGYTAATTIGVYITPTRTIFTVDAGPVRANISYLTPIELLDWTRHSLPFIYLTVDLWSTDGASHNLQFYTDITGESLSSDATNKIMWNSIKINQLVYHVMNQTTLWSLTENSDRAEDGSQYFAYKSIPDVSLTWQIASQDIRGAFIIAGNLTNTIDTNFRAINDDWPVSAFALDFGNITQTTIPLVFAMGLARDPVVTYPTVSQPRSPLWRKKWSNVGSAIDDFLSGYFDAVSRAVALDSSIVSATSAISSKFSMASSSAMNLADLIILSLRQTVGSLEFTASQLSNQGIDDLRVFMKDVGNSRRVNPVEIIYASFPAFLYLNATLAGRLLEPLLEFQSSELYGQAYAAPDLGSSWPNVLGNNTGSSFAIDSCGAMLVMALAHARKSGDGTLLITYYNLFRKWADFLVAKSLQPTGFVTADRLGSATSNLVLKGIMGIYAMGQINKILEARGANSSLTSHYLDTAENFAQQWQYSVLTSDHVLSSYGNNSSWGLLYNLYAPRLLGADIIPEQIYELQASWYSIQSMKAQPYGLPYESSQSVTVKAHWALLTAASIVNSTVSNARDALLTTVHARSFMKTGPYANPSTYNAIDGRLTTGTASPAMGAAFAFLALGLPNLRVNLPPGSVRRSTRGSGNQVLAIVGGILGGLAGIGFVILLVFLYVRLGRRKASGIVVSGGDVHGAIPIGPSLITPFEVSSLASLPIRHPEKLIPNQIGGFSAPTSVTESDSSVARSSRKARVSTSPQDGDLRREVEKLRMVVETLRDQQVPQPQVVYQDLRDVHDESPPEYGPPGQG